MHKIRISAAVMAAALVASLLAGCGSMAGSSSGASSGAASSASSATPSAASSEAAPQSTANGAGAASTGTQASGYSADALKTALDEVISYEVDSAGGSLKTAIAAAALLNCAVQSGAVDADTLGADAQAWLDGLTEEQKSVLNMNWHSACQLANDIVTDPAAQADLLTTAGVETDFTTVDLTNAKPFLDTLNSKLGAE